MTNYHPDVQRAYESHCADGYVVPDDETGPREATGGAVRDFPCCEAPGDGEAAKRRTEGLSVVERAAMILGRDGNPPQLGAAMALADAGLLVSEDTRGALESDVPRVQAHGDGEGLREAVEALADEWEADGPMCAFWGAHTRLRMVLAAHPAPTGDARGALDETLDDLTRTLARAEKAEAEVARYQRLVSWHEWHGSDAEARAADLEAAWSEACEVAGKAADDCAAKIARLREEAAMSYEDGYNQGHEDAHADGAAQDRLCRARDTAAALEAENARLTAKVERVEVLAATLGKEARSMSPCTGPNCGGCVRGRDAAHIRAALSDTTGDAS